MEAQVEVFTYDSTGNRLSVTGQPVPQGLKILAFVPTMGVPGDEVLVFGREFGFDSNAVTVRFNGVPAQVVQCAPTVLKAVVPNGATTGPIDVTVGADSDTTGEEFVIGGLKIVPEIAQLVAGGTVDFDVVVAGATSEEVVWSVEGVPGGNLRHGFISNGGVYQASPEVDAGSEIYVTARSVVAPALVARGVVQIVALRGPTVSRGVSVELSEPIVRDQGPNVSRNVAIEVSEKVVKDQGPNVSRAVAVEVSERFRKDQGPSVSHNVAIEVGEPRSQNSGPHVSPLVGTELSEPLVSDTLIEVSAPVAAEATGTTN